jgi:hypothetical protein
MLRLAALFYVIIAPTLMGIFVTATLVVEVLSDAVGIPLAAAAGLVVALPVSWFVARAIRRDAGAL